MLNYVILEAWSSIHNNKKLPTNNHCVPTNKKLLGHKAGVVDLQDKRFLALRGEHRRFRDDLEEDLILERFEKTYTYWLTMNGQHIREFDELFNSAQRPFQNNFKLKLTRSSGGLQR